MAGGLANKSVAPAFKQCDDNCCARDGIAYMLAEQEKSADEEYK